MPQPFHLLVSDNDLNDLRARLRAARRPAGVVDSGGLPLAEVDALVRYWLHDFDWRAQEQALNGLPQYQADIRGVRLHFVHVRSGRPPLLLLHGWPGSFVEMRHVIPLLADDFDLIVPSLPGYGFSPLPHAGFSNAEIADVLAELMSSLGYERFGIQRGHSDPAISPFLPPN